MPWDESWVLPGESLRNVAYRLAFISYCSTNSILEPTNRNEGKEEGYHLLFPNPHKVAALAAKMRVPEGNLWAGTLTILFQLFYDINGEPLHDERQFRSHSTVEMRILRYCPECMEEGFHSSVHQLREVVCCLRHAQPIRLEERCPGCRRQIPFFRRWRHDLTLPDPSVHCPDCGAHLASAERTDATRDELEVTVIVLAFLVKVMAADYWSGVAATQDNLQEWRGWLKRLMSPSQGGSPRRLIEGENRLRRFFEETDDGRNWAALLSGFAVWSCDEPSRDFLSGVVQLSLL